MHTINICTRIPEDGFTSLWASPWEYGCAIPMWLTLHQAHTHPGLPSLRASSACRVHTPFPFLLSYLSHWFVVVAFILWLQPTWPFDVGQRVSYMSVLLIVCSPDSLLLHVMPTGLLNLKVSWMLNFSSWAYSPVAASVIKSKGSRSICSFQIEDPLELYTLLLPSDLTAVTLHIYGILGDTTKARALEMLPSQGFHC